MLATREDQRGKGIASKLVRMACEAMIEENADEVSNPLPSLSPGSLGNQIVKANKCHVLHRSPSKPKPTTSPP